MDERVMNAQKWLNETYGENPNYSKIDENGRTGNIVMEALVTALQIEMKMTKVTGYFGNETATTYQSYTVKYGDKDSNNNIIRILQHALFCKGYNPTGVTGYFGDGTLKAVTKVQTDAGYTQDMISIYLNAKVFKEILSSDALICVSSGNENIRKIQQSLNRDYGEMFDIIPCDGLYNAKMAKALIYAFQKEGGLDIDTANGNFGPATQNIAKNHTQNISSYEENFVKLAKYALYCNGTRRNGVNEFDCMENDEFTGDYNEIMQEKVLLFQKFTGMLEVTGKIGLKEWMSLMVSSGYPKRNVLACDTATQLTDIKAKRLVANDFEIVGRYLTGSTVAADKYMTKEELKILFSNGLSVFAIYQDEKQYYKDHPEEETTVNYYNYNQGYSDAQKAFEAAEKLGIPYGECIFFSVDYDFNYNQTTHMVIPHFQGIYDFMRFNGSKYRIGVYAARNICNRIYICGYAEMCFVSDMSTGFSGNLGYALPENWTFDQIREYTQGDGSFNVDCVAISGKYRGFNLILSEQEPFSSSYITDRFIRTIYQVLGFNIDEAVVVDEHYEIYFPDFKISTEYKIGTSVTIGKGNAIKKIEIRNGECLGKEYEVSLQVLDNLSYNTTYSQSSENLVDLTNKVRYSIDNGYVEFGVSVIENQPIVIDYVIHKNHNIKEGIEDYVEIGIEIAMNNNITESQYSEYNSAREKVKAMAIEKELSYDFDMVWEFIASGLVQIEFPKSNNATVMEYITFILMILLGLLALA